MVDNVALDSLKLREYLQVPEIDLEMAGFVFDPYNPPPDTIVTESNEPLAIYDKAKKC